MAPIIGIGIGINRQYRVVSVGGVGPARTLTSVSVGTFSAGTYPVSIIGDAVNGEDVIWVLYSGTDPTLATEVAAGTWSGATVVDSGTFAWTALPAPITLVDNIARANYKLVCIVDNGELSNLVISSAFEVDTTDSLLTSESFTDNSAEGVNWSFTSNEDVSYRVSLWADGSTPSAAEIESGTGSVATVTGTAAATVAETGTFASVGDGTYVPTIWVSDDYLNEYTETYADVTVAVLASDPLADDTGRIFHITSADVEMGVGDNVAKVINLEGSSVDLSSIGAFNAPQKIGSGPIEFNSTAPGTVIQTPTADAAYRDHCQHLRGGGSNKIIMSAVVDASSFVGSSGVVFAESPSDSSSNAFYFGVGVSGGNIRLVYTANNASSTNALSEGSFITAVPASGLKIIQMEITQTTFEIWINNVSVRTGSVTAANFPNPTTARYSLGALASSTASAIRLTADVYEFFTTSSDNRSTIYTALATKYGI